MKYVIAGIGSLLFSYLCGVFIKASRDVNQWSEFARTTMLIFGIYFCGTACVIVHFMEPPK